MSIAISPVMRSTNARAGLYVLAAAAFSFVLGSLVQVPLHALTMISPEATAHVARTLHIPYGLAFSALETLADGGTVAACFAFPVICPAIGWASLLLAQVGIAAAAYA